MLLLLGQWSSGAEPAVVAFEACVNVWTSRQDCCYLAEMKFTVEVQAIRPIGMNGSSPFYHTAGHRSLANLHLLPRHLSNLREFLPQFQTVANGRGRTSSQLSSTTDVLLALEISFPLHLSHVGSTAISIQQKHSFGHSSIPSLFLFALEPFWRDFESDQVLAVLSCLVLSALQFFSIGLSHVSHRRSNAPIPRWPISSPFFPNQSHCSTHPPDSRGQYILSIFRWCRPVDQTRGEVEKRRPEGTGFSRAYQGNHKDFKGRRRRYAHCSS